MSTKSEADTTYKELNLLGRKELEELVLRLYRDRYFLMSKVGKLEAKISDYEWSNGTQMGSC